MIFRPLVCLCDSLFVLIFFFFSLLSFWSFVVVMGCLFVLRVCSFYRGCPCFLTRSRACAFVCVCSFVVLLFVFLFGCFFVCLCFVFVVLFVCASVCLWLCVFARVCSFCCLFACFVIIRSVGPPVVLLFCLRDCLLVLGCLDVWLVGSPCVFPPFGFHWLFVSLSACVCLHCLFACVWFVVVFGHALFCLRVFLSFSLSFWLVVVSLCLFVSFVCFARGVMCSHVRLCVAVRVPLFGFVLCSFDCLFVALVVCPSVCLFVCVMSLSRCVCVRASVYLLARVLAYDYVCLFDRLFVGRSACRSAICFSAVVVGVVPVFV